jgi:hypothetical protein
VLGSAALDALACERLGLLVRATLSDGVKVTLHPAHLVFRGD